MIPHVQVLILNWNGKDLLKHCLDSVLAIDYPDYAVYYPRNKMMFLPRMAFQLPNIIIKLIKEYLQTQKVIKDENIDIIISDSRYWVISKGVPTIFIMHQLRFQFSGIFKAIEFLGEWFNLFMFSK